MPQREQLIQIVLVWMIYTLQLSDNLLGLDRGDKRYFSQETSIYTGEEIQKVSEKRKTI